jgi:hypothetical protein
MDSTPLSVQFAVSLNSVISLHVQWKSVFLTSCVIPGLSGALDHGVTGGRPMINVFELDLSVFRKVSYLRVLGCFQQYIISEGVL